MLFYLTYVFPFEEPRHRYRKGDTDPIRHCRPYGTRRRRHVYSLFHLQLPYATLCGGKWLCHQLEIPVRTPRKRPGKKIRDPVVHPLDAGHPWLLAGGPGSDTSTLLPPLVYQRLPGMDSVKPVVAKKRVVTLVTIFIISIFISVAGAALLVRPDLLHTPRIQSFVHLLLATFRPDLYLFFVLGACLRHYKAIMPASVSAPLAILFLIGRILLYFYPHPTLLFLSDFLFPISLALPLQVFLEKGAHLSAPFFEWVGRNSLGIYLWHVLPILVLFPLTGDRPTLFYPCVIGSELLLFGFIWLSSRINFFRRYFYGLP